MQSRISRKIKRAENAGMRLLEQHHDFHASVEHAEAGAISMIEERQFSRPVALLHQVTSFEGDAECTSSSSKAKKGLKNDLRKMHAGADQKTFELYMSRLVKHRWFVVAVLKLRDFMKKMNNAVPECCLKLIVAVGQVLQMGFDLTESVFYQILEGVVTVKEDHQKTIVHQLLKILRDALQITAADFLQYLEDLDINPHPELSNQVRKQNKALSKKNLSASLSVRTTLARLSQQMSFSAPSAAAKVAFMVPTDNVGLMSNNETKDTVCTAAPIATTPTATVVTTTAAANTISTATSVAAGSTVTSADTPQPSPPRRINRSAIIAKSVNRSPTFSDATHEQATINAAEHVP